jgi:hypothetical protein
MFDYIIGIFHCHVRLPEVMAMTAVQGRWAVGQMADLSSGPWEERLAVSTSVQCLNFAAAK